VAGLLAPRNAEQDLPRVSSSGCLRSRSTSLQWRDRTGIAPVSLLADKKVRTIL
jgi:hypothetical protein